MSTKNTQVSKLKKKVHMHRFIYLMIFIRCTDDGRGQKVLTSEWFKREHFVQSKP